MYKQKTTIRNKTGLHARPASDFVACAKKFESSIKICSTEERDEVSAKSIVMLLSLGLGQGTEVEISASGADEKEAVDTLKALIESGFGEL